MCASTKIRFMLEALSYMACRGAKSKSIFIDSDERYINIKNLIFDFQQKTINLLFISCIR